MNTYDGLVRLDVYFNSREEALEFGRRVIEGYSLSLKYIKHDMVRYRSLAWTSRHWKLFFYIR